mmetsp:Transcript_25704/g.29573  ORF Transcript_25704/g.29573 Transcript_25704/m.29573 type:complete len:202 (-) Transcript_25704:7-612(-)
MLVVPQPHTVVMLSHVIRQMNRSDVIWIKIRESKHWCVELVHDRVELILHSQSLKLQIPAPFAVLLDFLDVIVKSFVVFNKRLEIFSVLKHVLNSILPVFLMSSLVAFELISDGSKKAVAVSADFKYPKPVLSELQPELLKFLLVFLLLDFIFGSAHFPFGHAVFVPGDPLFFALFRLCRLFVEFFIPAFVLFFAFLTHDV